ncbi:MAG TPA: T9SS type A sorting domain-containing protein [Fulvivirga sp.]|nr:T9SS type A sorting domain-containing protein [Fulvivirga sp.]
MKKHNYQSKVLAIVLSLVFISAIFYIQLRPSSVDLNLKSKASIKSKPQKKSLIVSNHRYDGPEKFAYYHSAIRAGQEDVTAHLIYPQYEAFYKKGELQRAKKRAFNARKEGVTFIERGPANVPGRTRTIVVDPDDGTLQTWFAGNVSGGIWKTTNGGTSWNEVAPDLANMAIVTLAMSESNSSVIYAGTGEGFVYNGTLILNGDGIYKSIDKGVSWSLLNSTTTEDFRNVSRIIVDPTNENIVVASTAGRKILGSGAVPAGAIMRSTDGGVTWDKVYDTTGPIQQIVAAPSDFSTQYAAIGNGLGVIKSTDAGVSWTDASNGLNVTGRIELGVSFSDPDKVYGSTPFSGDVSNLYLTTDGGSNWEIVLVKNSGNNVNFLGGQGWYDNTVMVHPFNDDKVYFGGVGVFQIQLNPSLDTSNGLGSDLTIVADVYNAFGGKNSSVHPDQHFLTPIITDEANNKFKILLGNDGGIYASKESADPGTANGDWIWSGAKYNTTQFYGADKVAGVERYGGGAQDNGTWLSAQGETASSTSEYDFFRGGDGFEVVAHYTDPLKFIGGSQFNGFAATEDGGATQYDATNGLTGNGLFVSRLSSAYQDPDVLFAVESSGVFKSTDFGKNWKEIPIGTGWGFWSGTDVEVSKADPRIVWAGGRMDSNGNLFVSTDGGESFNAVPNFANIGLCTGIYSHPTEDSTAFAVFSVSDSPKVLRTDDLGQTWEDISGFSTGSTSVGFPNVATFALQAMPYDPNVLWAGTEIGLFETVDGGANWQIINEFPSVTIWDFKIKDGQVIIATHGRGIWTADIAELAGFTAPAVTLVPTLDKIGKSLTELSINLSYTLRANYDSADIVANDEIVENVAGNSNLESQEVEFTVAQAGNYVVHVSGFKDGVEYKSANVEIEMTDVISATASYVSDFEDNTMDSDFNLDERWEINTASGSGFTRALNTLHPYPTGDELGISSVNLIAQLNIPIIVAEQNATITFDEIVQVEEGTAGTVFGDAEFWDYVIVEGSKDGVNWTPLLDGYDSDANASWNGSSTTATSNLYVTRTIDMKDTFVSGDVVLIRFRLYSDALSNGWGWAIENLFIQGVDEDGDGYDISVDCDDTNADINPGATEIPYNGIDDDCDESTPDDDIDQDGFLLADDCDDNNPAVNPDALEIVNNDIDDNCDGEELVLALDDNDSESGIYLYPNPASEEINLVINNAFNGNVQLEVIDINGKIRHRKEIQHNGVKAHTKINLAGLPAGVYFVKLKDAKTSVVKRMVIK